MSRRHFEVFGLTGLPEISPGDDLVSLIVASIAKQEERDKARDGDIFVIASKVVAKAENRFVRASDRDAAIKADTKEIVATIPGGDGGRSVIVRNHRGIVLAAAGVDSSNVPQGLVLRLPEDPDASAARICRELRAILRRDIGVLISDSLGRAWRTGTVDIALGVAGVRPVDDLRGVQDATGRVLQSTVRAVADEIAAAADLVKGKLEAVPVAIVRGLGAFVAPILERQSESLLRPLEEDLFRQGVHEAYSEGFLAGRRDKSS